MENKQTVYCMIGAPGSGKSTFAKSLVEKDTTYVRICPDDNRAILGSGEGDQSVSHRAFCMAKEQMHTALKEGKNVVFDATNMYRKARKDFILIAKSYRAATVGMVFELDKDTLIQRNLERGQKGGRNVPEEVIDRMLARYERPDETELDKVVFASILPKL